MCDARRYLLCTHRCHDALTARPSQPCAPHARTHPDIDEALLCAQRRECADGCKHLAAHAEADSQRRAGRARGRGEGSWNRIIEHLYYRATVAVLVYKCFLFAMVEAPEPP